MVKSITTLFLVTCTTKHDIYCAKDCEYFKEKYGNALDAWGYAECGLFMSSLKFSDFDLNGDILCARCDDCINVFKQS